MLIDRQHMGDNGTYYTIDGQRVYSKNQALAMCGGDPSRIRFHWMEDTWTNMDWRREPDLSWNELLRMRCQQIRDQHDHVALWYSGGYDSHTILEAFAANGILLDEILITDRRDYFDDDEVVPAITVAEHMKAELWPGLRINVVRTSADNVFDLYRREGESWIFHGGNCPKFAKTQKVFATTVMDEYQRVLGTSDQRADILGMDKPKVLLRDGKWFAFATDHITPDMLGRLIPFYFSADLPELQIKQCHMAIRWFESLPELDENLVHDIQGKSSDPLFVSRYYPQWNLHIGRSIPPTAHDISRLGTSKFFYRDDHTSPDSIRLVEHAAKHDTKAYRAYMAGLREIKRLNLENGLGDTLNHVFLSRQYYIKDRQYSPL